MEFGITSVISVLLQDLHHPLEDRITDRQKYLTILLVQITHFLNIKQLFSSVCWDICMALVTATIWSQMHFVKSVRNEHYKVTRNETLKDGLTWIFSGCRRLQSPIHYWYSQVMHSTQRVKCMQKHAHI